MPFLCEKQKWFYAFTLTSISRGWWTNPCHH